MYGKIRWMKNVCLKVGCFGSLFFLGEYNFEINYGSFKGNNGLVYKYLCVSIYLIIF